MSGSRRSRCQGVLEPRAPPPSHPGHHYHHHHHHQRRPHQPQRRQRVRNPWVAQESHSTSSSSGRTHHKTRPAEAPLPHHLEHHHPAGPRFLQPTFYGLPPSASPPLPERPLLHPHHGLPPSLIPAQAPQPHPPAARHPPPAHGGDSASTGTPTAPGSANSRCDGVGDGGGCGASAGGEGSGGWSGGGCGGQCPALDEFCFHCLRVAFVAGAVAGIGLVIAGAVLRLRLMVLVYIGGLTAVVSLILLGVHCCVRRDDAVRRRRLRELQKRRRGREGLEAGDGDYPGGQEGIPLRDLGPSQHHSSRVGSSAGTAPLYHGLVLQPPPPPAAFRSTMMVEPNIGGHIEELEIISVTGTSVWRQNEQNSPDIMETHH